MDKWLRNPNVMKVLALVLGILLWVVVRMEEGTNPGTSLIGERETKIYNVSITPKYDNTQYYIQSIEPAEVMVSMRGKDSALKKVTTGSYRIELDLSSVGKGEFNLPLKPVGFPASVNVEIYPPSVKVVLEEQQKKEMPVTVHVTGTPGEGLKAGQPIVSPNSRVHITLPSSRLDEVATVRAEVNIDGAQQAVKKQVKLVAYDRDGKEITDALITPAVVDVEVPITSPFKTIPLQLKVVGQPPPGYSVAALDQKVQQVTVYGQQKQLDRMDFYEGPQIDLSDLKESKDFSLDIPLKDNITKVDPSKVDVHVDIVPSATRALDSVPVTIVGQNDGFNTQFISPAEGKISLQLEGAPSLLDQVKLQDVQAFVDVSNLPPGQHDVKININLPAYVKNANPQEIKATLVISAKKPG